MIGSACTQSSFFIGQYLLFFDYTARDSQIPCNIVLQICNIRKIFALFLDLAQNFGISIVTYINQERLKLAAKRLRNSESTISSIAMFCGFSSAEYFSNLFKKEYGCSPLTHPRGHKKAEA